MNRRDFFCSASAAMAAGAAGVPFLSGYSGVEALAEDVKTVQQEFASRKSAFNMASFADKPYPTLRVGYIGLGNRGWASLKRLAQMKNVEIRAIGDCYEYPIRRAQESLKQYGCAPAAEYFASKEVWKDLCQRDDLDYIYVGTPPYCHAEMAAFAMECGKHVGTEVPIAQTLTDCWKLVETSERTRRHCVMLENCVYDFFEALTTDMAIKGVFGEIVHGQGAYNHFGGDWMFKEPMPPLSKESAPYYGIILAMGQGNRYPTHGFGPVCKAMRIHSGDRIDYLTSMETRDFKTAQRMNDLAATGNPYFAPFKDKKFCANYNTSLLHTQNGKTITVEYNTKNPRPYSRLHTLVGEKGFAQKYPVETICYESGVPINEAQLAEVKEKNAPELIRHIGETSKRFGGHGGMDFTIDWRVVDCLRNGLSMDINVYDSVLWSSLTPLSEWSVLNRSNSIDVPDFTGGIWETNPPIDFSLRGGGTTELKTAN